MKDLRRCVWEDHPENPLIEPPGWEWLIADPTVITPKDSPDGLFHMFANSLRGIRHYLSEDGVRWTKKGAKPLFPGLRPFIFVEDGFHLFYERIRPRGSVVAHRFSNDLFAWSKPRTILEPRFPWEGRIIATNGNPCLVKFDGRYHSITSVS